MMKLGGKRRKRKQAAGMGLGGGCRTAARGTGAAQRLDQRSG
jgi:hypothetical protein